MIYLLDTNTVSYILKGRSLAASERLLGLPESDIAAISAITVAEIRYGLARKPVATPLKALVEAFLASIQILPWGRAEAEAYGDLRARQEREGATLGNMDMMIAAHAIAVSATLVTNDKAFARVHDLPAMVNWATEI